MVLALCNNGNGVYNIKRIRSKIKGLLPEKFGSNPLNIYTKSNCNF